MENRNASFSLLDRICDAVIVIGGGGTIQYMNSAAEKLLEFSFEEVADKNAYDVIVVDHSFNSSEQDEFIFEAEEFRSRFFLITRTGRRIPVTLSASLHADTGSESEDIIIIIRNEIAQYDAEQKLEESVRDLRKTIRGVVFAIENTIAQRDPYTAGHQRRVSTLSRQIGQLMGLPRNTVECVRLAGVLHDIGKISIPAEILSKPSMLIPAEFELIKTHPQRGHEILQKVEFPWPIAEIVYQHHERIDGSGYPRGLRGEEIKIEARIITVADVVEAIASHRPYRAALGIDAAV